MADFQLIGNIAGAEAATVRLTVTFLSDYRDEQGRVPPPVMLFSKLPGQEWTAQPGGGTAILIGALAGQMPPRVSVTYTLIRPGLPPLARVLERYVSGNTEPPGYWDFTLPGSASGAPPTSPTQVNVLPGIGPVGPRGAALLHGEGPPAAGLGLDGDTYVNTPTWDVSVRSGGAWVAAGNIRGGPGAPGAAGLPGLNGAGGVPKPTPGQVGYILVADETQPNGFSWYAPGNRLRVRALGDVAISGISDGQTLVWDAAVQKFRPGDGKAGSGSNLDPEAVQDLVAAMLREGTGIALTYDDAGNTLSISSTVSGGEPSVALPDAPPLPPPPAVPAFTGVDLNGDWSQDTPGVYLSLAAAPKVLTYTTAALTAGVHQIVARAKVNPGDPRFFAVQTKFGSNAGLVFNWTSANPDELHIFDVTADGVHNLEFRVGTPPGGPLQPLRVYDVSIINASSEPLPVPVTDPQSNGQSHPVYGNLSQAAWLRLPAGLPVGSAYHFHLNELSAVRLASSNAGFDVYQGGQFFSAVNGEGAHNVVLRHFPAGDYYVVTHAQGAGKAFYVDWVADPITAGTPTTWGTLAGRPNVFPPSQHQHVSTNIDDFKAAVASLFTQGTNVTLTTDPQTGIITISATGGGSGGGLNLEAVQDAVAAMLVQGSGITAVYDDTAGTLTISSAGLPAGGTTGQLLTKNSATAGDAIWADPAGAGSALLGRCVARSVQNIPGSVWTRIDLAGVSDAANGAMAASVFTVILPGVYNISAGAVFTNLSGNHYINVAIRKNSQEAIKIAEINIGGGAYAATGSGVLRLIPGDVIEFYAYLGSAASVAGESTKDLTTLSIVRLGA